MRKSACVGIYQLQFTWFFNEYPVQMWWNVCYSVFWRSRDWI